MLKQLKVNHISKAHLSRPSVMSMKKKMIAQKKEKGIEAMASLWTKVTAYKRVQYTCIL